MPKVSVIIPNYNHARFLQERIESVLNQTFQDFEVLFLDDASTDDSLSVFNRYAKDPRIRAVINQENSGSPFIQWKRGLQEARGEFVWIAESDDYADERFLEKLTSVLEDNPAVGLVYCQSWLVDNQSKLLFENTQWTDDLDKNRWQRPYINRGLDEISNFLLHKNTIPNASAVLFRKDFAIQNKVINESLRYCGDWLCWINILQFSDIAYVSDSLNFWRQAHTASVRGTIDPAKRIQEILYLLGQLQEKDLIRPSILNDVLQRHYRQWLSVARSRRTPWSMHRGIVRKFSHLNPQIGFIDWFYAPLFLFHPLRNKKP